MVAAVIGHALLKRAKMAWGAPGRSHDLYDEASFISAPPDDRRVTLRADSGARRRAMSDCLPATLRASRRLHAVLAHSPTFQERGNARRAARHYFI